MISNSMPHGASISTRNRGPNTGRGTEALGTCGRTVTLVGAVDYVIMGQGEPMAVFPVLDSRSVAKTAP